MPIYWSLKSKHTGQTAILQELDDTICALIGAPVDKHHYAIQWYDSVGAAICDFGYNEALPKLLEQELNEVPRDEDPLYNEWFKSWKERRVKVFTYLNNNFILERAYRI